MTFYKQVREILAKCDPGRVYMARSIAMTFRTPQGQKEVLKALNQIYSNGGPGNIERIEKPAVETPVLEEVIEEVENAVEEVVETAEEETTEEVELEEEESEKED